jgi:ATP-dependent DNA helicase RecG
MKFMTADDLKKILQYPESENIEYKEAKTQYGTDKLIKYCVAFANEKGGKLLLGIKDNKEVCGTNAFLSTGDIKSKILAKLHIRVEVDEVYYNGKRVLVFDIPSRPIGTPLHYDGAYLMRSGEELLPMTPEQLQRIFAEGKPDFELQIATKHISSDEVVTLLDVQGYFDMMKMPLPETREAILDRFTREKFIVKNDNFYDVTNLGAILFAKDLSQFDELSRKAIRVIVYDGNSKIKTKLDITGNKGYAVGFQSLVQYIMGQLPASEVIENALRDNASIFPELAIRELIANAMIHQDFMLSGNSVMIEIYDNRIEISNPGKPIITVDRFIDEYQSRNEKLADVMRRLRICEEKGSGIDKTLFEIELFQLPALDIRVSETRTTVVVYAPKGLDEMSKTERKRACYQHCCLKYVMGEMMTNQSFRERLGLSDEKSGIDITSKVIRETVSDKMIRLNDAENKSKRYAKYVPFWS